jgi:hypothetical protein
MSARSKKIDKGPSWFEVGLGAFMSIVLGVVLGAAYLVFKPVQTVKAIPKDAPGGAIYYIEGAHDSNRTEEATEKRKSFAAGESVDLEEGEINVLLASGSPSAPAAAPAKAGQPPAPAAPQKAFDVGSLNARIHSGKIQFADTVKFNVFSFTGSLVVQADGDFRKDGSEFAFDPDTIYVGGCPVQRLLFVRGWILKKLLFAQPVPDDISAAWPKLADVVIEGSTLRLKMP